MKEFLNKYKKHIIIASAIILAVFAIFVGLDASNFPSSLGIEKISFDWINTFASLVIGLSTIFLTVFAFCQTERISKRQDKLDKDELASDNFYRITFIEKYQRLEIDAEKPNLKLKIREMDKNLFKKISIKNDVTFHHLYTNEKIDPKMTIAVSHDEYEIEHTDKGTDHEWKKDKGNIAMDAFAYIRFELMNTNEVDLDFFQKDGIYKLDLTIDAINLFNVKTRCRLHPWFVVTHKQDGFVQFRVEHNFGHYDSVEYVGNEDSKNKYFFCSTF